MAKKEIIAFNREMSGVKTGQKLIAICGATATGKSSLALKLGMCGPFGILSADSRQVYREFNIGTAKPTPQERALVPHYLIDICDPTETMTLADYQQKAQGLIESSRLWESGSIPLLVGGTGLYIKSIVRGMKIPKIAPNLQLRSQLTSLPQSLLYGMLRQVDPIAIQKIHPRDGVRTIRALEVFYSTGIPISQQQGENPPAYPILQLGLDCDVKALDERIRWRSQIMVKDGLLAEVEYLLQKYGKNLPLLNTLGYAEIKSYLLGEISLEVAQEQIFIHTRQLAKRQRTWFRAVPEIEWFDCESPDLFAQIWARIDVFVSE